MSGFDAPGDIAPYYDDGEAAIYCGDVLDVLGSVDLGGPDLVVTSPPYNLSVSAGGGFGHYQEPGA